MGETPRGADARDEPPAPSGAAEALSSLSAVFGEVLARTIDSVPASATEKAVYLDRAVVRVCEAVYEAEESIQAAKTHLTDEEAETCRRLLAEALGTTIRILYDHFQPPEP